MQPTLCVDACRSALGAEHTYAAMSASEKFGFGAAGASPAAAAVIGMRVLILGARLVGLSPNACEWRFRPSSKVDVDSAANAASMC